MDETALLEHRREFDAWLQVQLDKRNSTVMRKETYDSLVQYLLDKEAGNPVSRHERRIGKRVHRNSYKLMHFQDLDLYNVLCTPMSNKVKPLSGSSSLFGNYKRVVSANKLYVIIDRAHRVELNHAGINRTIRKIGAIYANLPRVSVTFFVSTCPVCIAKRALIRSTTITPTVSVYFFQRIQINLINMSESPDGLFTRIVHVADHFTKYTILFPIVEYDAAEIAEDLITKVFSYFGLPKVIYSENGTNFVDDVLAALEILWPGTADCVTVNEIQSESENEEVNEDNIIKTMIKARENDEQSSDWSKWLAGIQLALNSNHVPSLNKSPYEAVFKQKMNLCNMEVSPALTENNDNDTIMEIDGQSMNSDEGNDISLDVKDCISDELKNKRENEKKSPQSQIACIPNDVEKEEFNVLSKVDRESLKPNNKAMVFATPVKNSLILLPCNTPIEKKSERKKKATPKKSVRHEEVKPYKIEDFNVGQTVSVSISKQERRSSDIKHIPCIITDKSGGGKMPTYQLLSAYGTLKQRFTAAKLMSFPYPINCGSPEVIITLREVVEKTIQNN